MSDEFALPNTIADEGRDSYLAGIPRQNCPYPPGAAERDAWLSGWDKAAV
jgi:ribosome modulation factor